MDPDREGFRRLLREMTQQLVHKTNDNVDAGFNALVQKEMGELLSQFKQEGDTWVAGPVNKNKLLYFGKELSELNLIHAKMNAATSVIGDTLLNPKNYQFVDPSGRSRVKEGYTALTKKTFKKLIIPLRHSESAIERGRKMGINISNPPDPLSVIESDPQNPEAPHETKYFTMHLTESQYNRLPIYVMAKALKSYQTDIRLSMNGRKLIVPNKREDDIHIRLLKSVSEDVELLASQLNDPESEISQVLNHYLPAEEDRALAVQAVTSLYEQLYDMRLTSAKKKHPDIDITSRRAEIRKLFSPNPQQGTGC